MDHSTTARLSQYPTVHMQDLHCNFNPPPRSLQKGNMAPRNELAIKEVRLEKLKDRQPSGGTGLTLGKVSRQGLPAEMSLPFASTVHTASSVGRQSGLQMMKTNDFAGFHAHSQISNHCAFSDYY